MRAVMGAVLLFCVSAAHGDCISLLRESSSGVFNRTSSAVAWNGSALGVVKVENNDFRSLLFAMYSSDLTPLTGDRRVTDATFAGVTALLWTGSEFGLFFQDRSSAQLYLQRIAAAGDPIGGPIAVAPNHSPSGEREYDVTWDASRQAYVILHSILVGIDKGMWLTMLNANGTLRSDDLITTSFSVPALPRLAVNSSGAIIVLFRRAGMFYYRVNDAAGAGGGPQPLVNAHEVRVASNATTFTIIASMPATVSTEIDWAVIDEHGAIVQPIKKLFAARGVEIAPVALFWNETRGEWALSYLDSRFPFTVVPGDYRLRRFTPSGAVITDSLFSPDSVFSTLATNQPFAWNGSSYLTAASRVASGSTQPESYLIRLCPLTASIGGRRCAVQGIATAFSAIAEGGRGDLTYSWDFGDTSIASGKSVTHVYEHLGDYTLSLRVTDSTGATNSNSIVVHVVASASRRRSVHH